MAASNRPVAITVICVIGFIGALLSVPLLLAVLSGAVNTGVALPGWYGPYLGLSIVIGLVSMIGLWMMKKWGAILYAVLFLVNQIVLFTAGLWSPFALLIPLIVIAVAFSQFSKME